MKQPSTRREKEIWQVCEALWEEHGEFKALTGDAIAEKLLELGFTKGSPNERYKYRASWKAAKGIKSEQELELAKPILADPIQRAVVAVHAEIQAEFETKLQAAAAEAATTITALRADLADKIAKLEAIKTLKIALVKELDEIKSKLAATTTQLITANESNTMHCAKITSLEQAHDAALKSHAEVMQNFKAMHSTTVAELQAATIRLQAEHNDALNDLRERMETQRHQWLMTLDNLKMENNKLTLKLEQEKHVNSKLENDNKKLAAVNIALTTANNTVKQELSQKDAELQVTETNLANTLTQLQAEQRFQEQLQNNYRAIANLLQQQQEVVITTKELTNSINTKLASVLSKIPDEVRS